MLEFYFWRILRAGLCFKLGSLIEAKQAGKEAAREAAYLFVVFRYHIIETVALYFNAVSGSAQRQQADGPATVTVRPAPAGTPAVSPHSGWKDRY